MCKRDRYNKEQQGIQNKTGYNGDQDILKNIYDLEGNNYEWTALTGAKGNRTVRGSRFLWVRNYSDFSPASRRQLYNTISAINNYTTRATIFLEN